MSDLDQTCRICRGEASIAQPLLHPCKCRGSIRYIHQDCLLEWLRHSNKTTKKCDICNTPYKFEAIYDPNMPQSIPAALLWAKLVRKTSAAAVRATLVFLYVACVIIQIPLFWKFSARIYTWTIDGTLPQNNPTIWMALLFGEYDFDRHAVATLTPAAAAALKVRKFMEYTYFSGLRYVLMCMVVLLAIFVEHEWIVRDEGYHKMIERHIGKEPRAMLVDLLQDAIQRVRNDSANGNGGAQENLQQLERFSQALRNLQEQPQLGQRGQELRGAIDGVNAQGDPQPPGDNSDHDSDSEDEDEIVHDNADFLNDADEAMIANDVFEIFGLNLNLSAPLLAMGVCNAVIVLLLFVFYFIPYLCSILVLTLAAKTIKPSSNHRDLVSTAVSFIGDLSFGTSVHTFCHQAAQNHPWIALAANAFHATIIIPACREYERLFVLQDLAHPSLLERTMFLVFGYAFFYLAINRFMIHLAKGKPLTGTARKMYTSLFEVTTTAKVFLIFAIEMFFFPVYCGWLLDFCIAPLFLDSFVSEDGRLTVLFSSSQPVLQVHYVRLFLFWALGTLYMLFFALFVGMIRSKILRPGVLYFIRSPDDPNTRLIHDALVKPLSLQMSRIFLSAKVYSCFIVFGIGGITWGIRLLLSFVFKSDHVVLPVRYTSFNTVLIGLLNLADVSFCKQTYTRYCFQYWKRAFEVSAHKLRLSHFILGKPVAQERGFVIYRNILSQFLGSVQPDFSRPVTYKDAQKMFREKEADALFVPNGSYVRAPDNDTISRRFIRKMFVQVTKDDKLLREVEHDMPADPNDTDSSDEGMANDNRYTIVYRPPNFKLRCLGLVWLVWLFSAFLIIGVLFSSLVIGKLLMEAIHMRAFLSTIMNSPEPVLSHFQADLMPILLGLKLELLFLWSLRKKRWNVFTTAAPLENEAREEAPNHDNVLLRDFIPFLGGPPVFPSAVYLLSSFMWGLWIASVHKLCIDLVAKSFVNVLDPSEMYLENFTNFLINRYTIVLHALAALVTVVPFVFTYALTLRVGNLNRFTWSECLHWSGLSTVLVNFAALHGMAILMRVAGRWVPMLHFLETIRVWAVLLTALMVVKAASATRRLYRSISEQVRNEKYVRGRAIINDSDE